MQGCRAEGGRGVFVAGVWRGQGVAVGPDGKHHSLWRRISFLRRRRRLLMSTERCKKDSGSSMKRSFERERRRMCARSSKTGDTCWPGRQNEVNEVRSVIKLTCMIHNVL